LFDNKNKGTSWDALFTKIFKVTLFIMIIISGLLLVTELALVILSNFTDIPILLLGIPFILLFVLWWLWALGTMIIDATLPVLVMSFITALILSLTADMPIQFYIFIMALCVFDIGLSQLRNRVIFKIGIRNIYRRKGYTAIVISGLMIGTVIISASLIIGDTMENMITSINYDIYHEVDEALYYYDSDYTLAYVSEADFEELKAEIEKIDNVDAVGGEIHESVAVRDVTSGQSEPSIRLLGYDTSTPEFGKYYVDGKAVPFDIEEGEVYLNDASQDALDASAGDRLVVFTASGEQNLTVRAILDDGGRENMAFTGMLMPVEHAQKLLGVGNAVNYIQVTNKGGVKGGEKYCEQVTEDIDEIFDVPRYNLTYRSFNKVGMGIESGDFEEFKVVTYGNVPDDFEIPNAMTATEDDIVDIMKYDAYLYNTAEIIVFDPPLDEGNLEMLTSDLGGSGLVDGVTPELDLVFDLGGNELGILGVLDNPAFGNFTMNGTLVDMSLGAYANAESNIQPNSTVTVSYNGSTYDIYIAGVVDPTSRAMSKSLPYIFMDLTHMQDMLGMEGQANILRVSDSPVMSEDPEEMLMLTIQYGFLIHDHVDTVFEYNIYKGLEVGENKAEVIENGREGMGFFTDMFLVFGSFSIIAGVILIINIFVMLGEERKGEMGISRAVGMKRFHLSRSFVYEGSVYAVVSAVVGALLGIVVAYLIMFFLDMLFGSMTGGMNIDILGSFDFTALSLTRAFTFGFLITCVTVSFASWRISRLNIVRAIRNIPEPKISKKSLLANIIGGGMVFFGGLATLFALTGAKNIDTLSGWEIAIFYCGVSVAIFGVGFIIRRFIGDRWAFTIVSVANLVFWMIPSSLLDLPAETAGMEMFILSGLFVVSSAVIAFIYNSTAILSFIVKLYSVTGRPTASLKTATSYPMKNKFRTGLTIYMFALIIFTITVMSMITGMMSYNINNIMDEQIGGIDIYGIANTNRVIDNIYDEINASENLTMDMFEGVYAINAGSTELNTTVQIPGMEGYLWYPMAVYGYGEDFARDSEWPFDTRMEGLDTDRDVWTAVEKNSSYIILDGTFASETMMGGGGGGGGGDGGPGDHTATIASGISQNIRVGKNVTLLGPNGEHITKTIAGILKQFFIGGVFIGKTGAAQSFNATFPMIYMFNVVDDAEADDIAKIIERELSIETMVLRTLVKQITDMMEQFFNLFSAFMGLGLVVGIAGLGIITLRAVHERRLEIGMMRAIGFKRRSVTLSFMMEASFIALVGILLGTALGIMIGFNIWYDGFRSINFDFYIPWTRIIVVGLIAYFATAIFTIYPSFKASKVTPAEALRFD